MDESLELPGDEPLHCVTPEENTVSVSGYFYLQASKNDAKWAGPEVRAMLLNNGSAERSLFRRLDRWIGT